MWFCINKFQTITDILNKLKSKINLNNSLKLILNFLRITECMVY